jgi:tRNA/rRNA methyltransferase
VFGDTRDAIADLNYVVATTARNRDLIKPVVLPDEAANACREHHNSGTKSGILFGAESSGLANEDVVISDAILQVATNPDFSSINIAQAVLLVSYEWFKSGLKPTEVVVGTGVERPATREEMFGFMDHMERELEANGFFYPPEKKLSMIQNLRNIWMRADFREQDIRTLRGVISTLVKSKRNTED